MSKWRNWFSIDNKFKLYKNIPSNLIKGTRAEGINFSIVIPIYTRYEHLSAAIESAINQNINEEYEIVIFDNSEIIDEKKFKIITQYINKNANISYYQNVSNLGMFGNFNRAIEMANGKWVVVLHDDDILNDNYLMTMAKYVDDEIGMICPHPSIVDNRKVEKKKKNSYLMSVIKLFHGLKPIKLKDFYLLSGVSPICALLNKKHFIDMGGYDETLYPSSDMAGVMKLLIKYPVYYLPKTLFSYRYDVNESLNEKTSLDFIQDTYDITSELGEYLSYNKKKVKRQCDENVSLAIAYSLIQDKSELFTFFSEKYKIPNKYQGKYILIYLKVKNQFNVFKRLFRGRK